MKVISVRESPTYKDIAIAFTSASWSNVSKEVYSDCISHLITAITPLPQWYLLEQEQKIIGCAGLITNDFISRMDLYPWLCALYIMPAFRGKGLIT